MDNPKSLYYLIDLRTYGSFPYLPIEVAKDDIIYLTNEQIKKVSHVWSIIDPDTNSGILFSQMIESMKPLCELYMKSL